MGISGIKEIKTSRGIVCAAKPFPFSIENDGFYNILFYILTTDEGNGFVCTCLNLLIEGRGETSDLAEKNMAENVRLFIDKKFNESPRSSAWNDLIIGLHHRNETTKEFWDAFFKFREIHEGEENAGII